jgi:4-amino-4-deoxy-L-arabinose transferase-like glycosyltransferase
MYFKFTFMSNFNIFKSKITYSDSVFWIAACILLFWALGYRGLWGPEGRWAEIVREMFLKGDFFHPTINGEPYFDKPLLTYWVIALVTAVTGRLDEWAVRLPGAISGLLSLWATIYMGRRLWTEEVGRTAGWILLTTYGFLFWSRTGTANIENIAAITLAVSWYWAMREKPGFWSYLGFYLICFTGAHFKGLTAIVIPMLAILPDAIRRRRWLNYLSISHLMALAIGVTIYLIPFIIASKTASAGYQESGLAMVFQENIQRYFRPFDHKEPPYVYFYYLPLLFLPWTPIMLTALFSMVKSYRKLDTRTKWLLEAAFLIILFYTVSGSRRNYYILPVFPFCALLSSVFLTSPGEDVWKRIGIGLQGGLIMLVAVAEIGNLAIWPLIEDKTGFVPPLGFKTATLLIGILGLTPWVVRRFAPDLLSKITGTGIKTAPVASAVVILIGGFFCWQQNTLEAYRAERPFLMELKAQVAGIPPGSIAIYRKNMADVVFYLDPPGPVKILKDNDAVADFFGKGEEMKVLIARRKDLSRLLPVMPRDLGDHPTLCTRTYSWQHKESAQLLAWKMVGRKE